MRIDEIAATYAEGTSLSESDMIREWNEHMADVAAGRCEERHIADLFEEIAALYSTTPPEGSAP